MKKSWSDPSRLGIIALVGILCVIGCLVAATVVDVSLRSNYSSNCGVYLEGAAAAETVERAHQMLAEAVAGMERTGRTSGSTAFIFHTLETNVGIWYQNYKSLLAELAAVTEATSAQERSILLLKVRLAASSTPPNIHIVAWKYYSLVLSVTSVLLILVITVLVIIISRVENS